MHIQNNTCRKFKYFAPTKFQRENIFKTFIQRLSKSCKLFSQPKIWEIQRFEFSARTSTNRKSRLMGFCRSVFENIDIYYKALLELFKWKFYTRHPCSIGKKFSKQNFVYSLDLLMWNLFSKLLYLLDTFSDIALLILYPCRVVFQPQPSKETCSNAK